MINGRLQVATVFSGIGAFEQALLKLNVPYDVVFACDNGEREISSNYEDIMNHCKKNNMNDTQINEYVKSIYSSSNKVNHMKDSYFANYKITEDRWYEDVRFINGNNYANKVDIFVGGSPCQSFSMMGKRGGLEDARGNLFYEYARLVKQMQPKVFIYENVPGMLNHDNGRTWEVINDVFQRLNYHTHVDILNAKDYGIPQNRSRLFVVGFKKEESNFKFPEKIGLNGKTMFDFLENKVAVNHYLGKKGFEFVTNPKYRGRARINNDIIRTQKANQQFNWNGDFVFEPLNPKKHTQEILNRAYVGEWNGEKGVIRQLSYRECYRLMGFSDKYDYSKVNNVWRYRQAGNSIVVNVLENIFKEIIKVESFNE